MFFLKNKYYEQQLRGAGNNLLVDIDREYSRVLKLNINLQSKMYTPAEVKNILSECEKLVEKLPESKIYWTKEARTKLNGFLSFLPKDAYLTPEQKYITGKHRDYKEHIEFAIKFINSKDDIILDVAGRTGWASTILNYLGYAKALTVELNPINIIGGKYIWGHKNIIQGDVATLRNCKNPVFNLNLSLGNAIDFIFIRYSLEHFNDLKKVYNELYYVLKPQGKLFLIVGQSDKTCNESGDLHAFPTIESVYESGKFFEPEFIDDKVNSETNQNQFFVCLRKK
ncbi:MAG: methyltransferase domain-containing protein [Spirochaetota bacterium]